MGKITYGIRTNKRKRHGTITAYEDGKAFAKYRVILSREELEEAEFWTSNDIWCFLHRNEAVVLW